MDRLAAMTVVFGAVAACSPNDYPRPATMPPMVPLAPPSQDVASSGSNSHVTTFTCAGLDPTSPQNRSCASCLSAHCNGQMSAAFGPTWTAEDFTGGSCEAYVVCAAKCTCAEQGPCVRDCETAASTDCKRAQLQWVTCLRRDCGVPCGDSVETQ